MVYFLLLVIVGFNCVVDHPVVVRRVAARRLTVRRVNIHYIVVCRVNSHYIVVRRMCSFFNLFIFI